LEKKWKKRVVGKEVEGEEVVAVAAKLLL